MTETNPNPPVGYGVIGAGRRTLHLLRYLAGDPRLALRGVYDPNPEAARALAAEFGSADTTIHPDRSALLADADATWVIVGSPNHCHKDDIAAAFEAGKHVFAEKPLATTVEDCIAIDTMHRQRPELRFATGFVLRYAPLYRQVKQLLDEGAIGDIVSVAASENITPAHGGHIMSCWRRHTHLSGSHLLEKCCHDIDLLLWFIGSLPVRVASFGGNDLFTSDREDLLHKFKPPAGKESVYLAWDVPSRDTQNPFTAEKSVVDHQVAILEFANRVSVTFQTTMNNAIPERRLYITGTEGTLIAELYSQTLRCRRIGEGEETRHWTWDEAQDHGGGDLVIMSELAATMAEGASVTCGGAEALRSAVVSLAIERARLEGRVVDLTDIWQRLGLSGALSVGHPDEEFA